MSSQNKIAVAASAAFASEPLSGTRVKSAQEVIAIHKSWYAALEQTESFAGFSRVYQQTGCEEYLDDKIKSPACYVPFADGRFVNVILHNPRILDDVTNAFICDLHETLHAIHINKTAALHAAYHNLQQGIVLSPRSFIFLHEALEHDSYSRSSAALYFLERTGIVMPPTRARSCMPPEEFADLYDNAKGDLHQALWFCGDTFLDEIEKNRTLRNFYRAHILTTYETQAARYAGSREFRYVSAGLEDLYQISTAFGPNSRGPANGFYKAAAQPAPFTRAQTARINALHARYGIPPESELPTFGQALKDINMTRDRFLELSKSRVPEPAKTLAPGAIPA